MGAGTARGASPAGVWAALWVVYVIWGSTYLAIRVAVHPAQGAGVPPLLLAGARFVVAGLLMLAVTLRRPARDGQPDPLGPRQWASAAVIGLALLLGGNGLVSIAEQRIPSGMAALVVATVPIWAALLAAAVGQERIALRHGVGLTLGFVGVGVLVAGSGSGKVGTVGVLTVVAAALSWAAGSVWSRTAVLVRRPLVMTGMEMLCGGIGCLVTGVAIGEPARLHLSRVPPNAWWAAIYLVVAGSMLAYTAYAWLLLNAPLSLVTTYAFVNPLVAVVLGALLLHEAFTGRAAVATVTIVTGVALIVLRGRTPQPPASTVPEPASPARDEAA